MTANDYFPRLERDVLIAITTRAIKVLGARNVMNSFTARNAKLFDVGFKFVLYK